MSSDNWGNWLSFERRRNRPVFTIFYFDKLWAQSHRCKSLQLILFLVVLIQEVKVTLSFSFLFFFQELDSVDLTHRLLCNLPNVFLKFPTEMNCPVFYTFNFFLVFQTVFNQQLDHGVSQSLHHWSKTTYFILYHLFKFIPYIWTSYSALLFILHRFEASFVQI